MECQDTCVSKSINLIVFFRETLHCYNIRINFSTTLEHNFYVSASKFLIHSISKQLTNLMIFFSITKATPLYHECEFRWLMDCN